MPDPDIHVRALTAADRDAALRVINAAALWYRDFLAEDERHEPEMSAADWDREAARMRWYGAFLGGDLVGVMGLERVADAALLRHAYVPEEHQRHGVGTLLARHLEREAGDVRRIVVGTYAANYKARRALEGLGYHLSADSEAVLRAYYDIPEDRLRTSVTYEKAGRGTSAAGTS